MTAAPMNRFPGRPNGPFMWGRGGKRMTPEDLTLQRRLAASQLASGADYSPVGHWTQGLARVAGGLAGGVNMRRADQAAERNAAETSEVMQALLAGSEPVEGAADPVAAALANPYISDEARRLALNVWESRQPKAVEPVIKQRNDGSFIGLHPITGEVLFENADPNPKPVLDWLRSTDPVTGEISLIPVGPNGPIMGGGGPASGVAGTMPPATLPPDFDFGEGGPALAPGNFPAGR